jgi:hypothetical protein
MFTILVNFFMSKSRKIRVGERRERGRGKGTDERGEGRENRGEKRKKKIFIKLSSNRPKEAEVSKSLPFW